MRIAILLSATGPNGVSNYYRTLIKHLTKRGHAILLVHRPINWICQEPEFSAVARFETPFALRLPEILEVGSQILRFNADVIHTHMSAAHAYGGFYSLFGKIPVVATAHAMHVQLHWRLNDYVIATSHEAEKYHRRFNLISKKRIETIPLFVNIEYFRPPTVQERDSARHQLSIPREAVVIGFVGDLISRKRPEDLLIAFAKLARSNHRVRLLMVGGPDTAVLKLKRLATSLAVEERVLFLGATTEIRTAYWAMDIFGHASGKECGPLAVLEAAASGLPVVATNVGMNEYYVHEGVSGFVVNVGDLDQLAIKLLTLCDDVQKRSEFSFCARKVVENNYSTEMLAGKVEKALEKSVRNAREHKRHIVTALPELTRTFPSKALKAEPFAED